MRQSAVCLLILSCFYSCQRPAYKNPELFNPAGLSIETRVKTPEGYLRVADSPNSFGAYLRSLPLKPDSASVHYYDGKIKENKGVYVAVIDMPIGNRNLHQCADAVMHLRAQYLYDHGWADKIHFNFTNGFRADYSKWKEGYRIIVTGNKCVWKKKAPPSDSFSSYWQYLEIVFTYCGSLSLSRELAHIDYKDLAPGDILIKGGTPGHAEIVMDVAQNKDGKKIYLLAESAMPAQEIQILSNPTNARLSPWYELNENDSKIVTPEDNFKPSHAMRFPED